MFSGTILTCYRGSRRVFGGVDFSVNKGEALLLTGANGSGKSSLLRMMAGLLKPRAGNIFWDGQDIKLDSDGHNARLCLVTQDDPVKAQFSALEQLSFWAKLSGADSGPGNIRAVLSRLGLEKQENTQGRFLSAGQKRRLNLCRLFLKPIPLWLLDEPVTALDSVSAKMLHSEIEKHTASGGMTVIATHDVGGFSGNVRNLALS